MVKKTRSFLSADAVAAFINTPVFMATGGRGNQHKGEKYGVELEVEGSNVRMEGRAVKGWIQVEEGSLRGENVEYTFSSPCSYEDALTRVNKLFEAFTEEGVRLKNSYRCSTHVHLNFANQPIRHVVNFFMLYSVLEQILEEYCGETRRGNVFCLSNRDVEPVVDNLSIALLQMQSFMGFGENIRYCGVNLAALNKFGTVEIRTMRGADNAEMVNDWLGILHNMWEFTEKMCSPADLLEQISLMGIEAWLQSVFTLENYRKIMSTWPLEKNLQSSIYDGVRLVQVLAYRLDEAYKMEIPKEEDRPKKRKAVPHGNYIIENGYPAGDMRRRRLSVPRDYIHGTRVQGIEPEMIIYDEPEDAWIQIRDHRGLPMLRNVRWWWQDEVVNGIAIHPDIVNEVDLAFDEGNDDDDD